MRDRAVLGKAEYQVAMTISRRMAHRETVPTVWELIREVGLFNVICSLEYVYRMEKLGMIRKISLLPAGSENGVMPAYA